MAKRRDRIEIVVWDEFVQAKSWEQYISDYTGSRMDWRKIYSILAISIAIMGGTTWGLWKVVNAEWVTPVMFGLLAIAQLLSAIQKNIVVSNEDLQSLSKLRCMYIKYTDQLERLYLQIDRKELSIEQIEDHYFTIREVSPAIEELKDYLNIKTLKHLDKEVEYRVRHFLESRYHNKASTSEESEAC